MRCEDIDTFFQNPLMVYLLINAAQFVRYGWNPGQFGRRSDLCLGGVREEVSRQGHQRERDPQL